MKKNTLKYIFLSSIMLLVFSEIYSKEIASLPKILDLQEDKIAFYCLDFLSESKVNLILALQKSFNSEDSKSERVIEINSTKKMKLLNSKIKKLKQIK